MAEKFYLHVDTTVTVKECPDFEIAMNNFLADGGFQRPTGGNSPIELVLALKSTHTFDFAGYGLPVSSLGDFNANESGLFSPKLEESREVRRYVHVWKLRLGADIPGLVRAMRACSEDLQYLAIDTAVLREMQEFHRQVNWHTGLELPPIGEDTRFVRTMRFFQTGGVPPSGGSLNYDDPHAYLFDLYGAIPVAAVAGWHAVGQLQPVTGLLNTLVAFWQTTSDVGDTTIAGRSAAIANALAKFNENRTEPVNLSKDFEDRTKEVFAMQTGGIVEVFEPAPYFLNQVLSKKPHDNRRISTFDAI